jgi:hypothetical protein
MAEVMAWTKYSSLFSPASMMAWQSVVYRILSTHRHILVRQGSSAQTNAPPPALQSIHGLRFNFQFQRLNLILLIGNLHLLICNLPL